MISGEEYEQTQDEYKYLVARRTLTLETYHQDSLFRRVQIEGLEESVARMQANLEIVKQKLQNLTIKAPIKGQLTALDAEGLDRSMFWMVLKSDVLLMNTISHE